MRRDMLHKCVRTWYWNATVLRKVRHAVRQMRRVLVAKAFRTLFVYAAVLRGIRDLVLRKAETTVASAFLLWCENVSKRRRNARVVAAVGGAAAEPELLT